MRFMEFKNIHIGAMVLIEFVNILVHIKYNCVWIECHGFSTDFSGYCLQGFSPILREPLYWNFGRIVKNSIALFYLEYWKWIEIRYQYMIELIRTRLMDLKVF